MRAKPSSEQLGLFDGLTNSSKSKQGVTVQTPSLCPHCIEQYLSDHQVAIRFDISKATVWRWHDNNPNFPRRIKLSPGTSRWKLSELIQFEAEMQAESRSSALTPTKGLSK